MEKKQQLSQAIATVERQISEAKSETAKKALTAKLGRLKEDLRAEKSGGVSSLTTLSQARKVVKALDKTAFEKLVEKLSEKPEYAFLKDYSQDRLRRDALRTAKPRGYRFKGDNNAKPTIAQIKKGLKDGTVYYEGRPIRSDVNSKVRLGNGGSVSTETIDLKLYNIRGQVVESGKVVIDYDNETITLGSGKKYKVEPNREYTYRFLKTKIIAVNGIKGLSEFLKEINAPKKALNTVVKAFIDSDESKMATGGHVSKGEMVWNKLSKAERLDFLYENFTPQITPITQEAIQHKRYVFLPKNVKIVLESKYANVEEYAKGGGVSSQKKYEIELFFAGLSGEERKIGKYVVSERTLDKLEDEYSGNIEFDVLNETESKAQTFESVNNDIIEKAKSRLGTGKMAKGGGVGSQKKYEIELFFAGLSGEDRKIGKYVVSERTLDKLEDEYSGNVEFDVLNETESKAQTFEAVNNDILEKAKSKFGTSKMAKGGNIEFRSLAKSNNFDIIVPEGRFEVELDSNKKVKSVVHPSGERHQANECPIYQKYKKDIKEYLTERFENGGNIASFNWKSFTLKELNEALPTDVEIASYETPEKEYNRPYSPENKKFYTTKKLTISQHGEAEISKGGENIYLEIKCYNAEDKNDMSEYEVQIYSKENHAGLKEVANSVIEKMKDGGSLGDYLPPTKTYAENLEKAMAKFGISNNEARKRYGSYTIKQWSELLDEKMENGGELGDISKSEIPRMQKITKLKGLYGYMPSINTIYYDSKTNKFYFQDFEGDYMEVRNISTLEQLDKFLKENNITLDKKMAIGGSISDNYEGKTPEDIWNSLSIKQKMHFLFDHVTEIEAYKDVDKLPTSEIRKAANSEWSNLDSAIKTKFTVHTREGQYATGGSVGGKKYSYLRNENISKIVLKSKQVIGADRILDGAYIKSKGKTKSSDKFSFPVGSVVWDKTHKRYGVVLNNFGNEFEGDGGEIRLDSDGVQPIFEYDKKFNRTDKYNLVPYGSKEDKGDGDLLRIKESGQRLIDGRKEKGDEEYVKYYQDAFGDVIAGKIDGKPFKVNSEKVIGETSTGKSIYQKYSSIPDLSYEELKEASEIHKKFSKKAKTRDEKETALKYSREFMRMANEEKFAKGLSKFAKGGNISNESKNLSSMTGASDKAIENFFNENGLDHMGRLKVTMGVGRGHLSRKDFATAIAGERGNKYAKEIIDYVKTDRAFKMAKGGNLGYTYIPNEDIEKIIGTDGTEYGEKVILDGAYVTDKIRTPKMSRTQFEEDVYAYGEGGGISKSGSKIYKLRAEGLNDFLAFLQNGMYLKVKSFTVEPLGIPDVVVTFETDSSLSEIKEKLREIPDSHVMLETVKPINEYTGNREEGDDESDSLENSYKSGLITQYEYEQLKKQKETKYAHGGSMYADGGSVNSKYYTLWSDEQETIKTDFDKYEDALSDFKQFENSDQQIELYEIVNGKPKLLKRNSTSNNITYIKLSNSEVVVEIEKRDGKWVEGSVLEGEKPYGWGGKTYMGYLKPNDIVNWLNKDYKSNFQIVEQYAHGGSMYATGGGINVSDIKKEKQKMLSELFEKCGVFFAFSDKQFEENKTPLKEGEKYVSIGGGGYLPKGKVKEFQDGMEAIERYGKEKVKKNNLAEAEILDELQNHECFYTGDISDVVDLFEGTYTVKQIRDVYNKYREENQEYALGGEITAEEREQALKNYPTLNL